MPHKQDATLTAPGRDELWSGHTVHAKFPTSALYVSAGHNTQTPSNLYLPGKHSQSALSDVPILDIEPAGHVVTRPKNELKPSPRKESKEASARSRPPIFATNSNNRTHARDLENGIHADIHRNPVRTLIYRFIRKPKNLDPTVTRS
tara:strand:- start:1042 stop:1482 length:441 start_codon:yes stop_codon:yes gene_type:complete